MVRTRPYFIATLVALAIMPYDRPASAQIRTRPAPVQKPKAPAPTAPTPAPAPVAAPSKPGVPDVRAQVTRVSTSTLPTITYGTPQPRTLAAVAAVNLSVLDTETKPEPRQLAAMVGGQNVTGKALLIRGLDDIERADTADLPEGAKRLLLIHTGKIAANQSAKYVVNTELAREWMKTRKPVPPDIKPPEKKPKKKGCSTRHISMKCLQTEGEQVIEKGSDEWENLRQEYEDKWDDATEQLGQLWEEVKGCFADKTLSLNEIPVQFSTTPSMSIPIAGSAMEGSSGSKGEVKGSVGLGFPMQADFSAKLDLFYIPCLPFLIRPKELSADGTMTVGERLTASVSATGSFDTTFTIPPWGGPSIPIAMIPIVIAGVPVFELDISAYIEGTLQVWGQGKAEASFQLDNSNTVVFDFACNGGGCSRLNRKKTPAQETTLSESAGIQGQVFVKPAIYTALELNVYFGALTARAGPQPYLLGSVSGCAEAAAQQTAGGGSRSHESHVLTADLDWGIELRAEALVGKEVVGDRKIPGMENQHIWFSDLAPGGSTALVAVVEGTPQVVAGQSATYRVKMPSCYPYTDPVRYRVTWTGDATPSGSPAAVTTSPGRLTRIGRPAAATTPGCEWQAGEGTCTFDPKQDLVFNLTWPTAGNWTLTVAVIGDDHRRFEPEPKAAQLEITVDGGGTR